MLICGLLAGGVILFLALVIIGFTTMVSYRNRVVEAEKNIDQTVSQVEVVLQRRFDLIPNLVETVKGYADHESEVFREVARLRGQWSQSDSPEERQRISVELDPKLNEILVVAEQYPNLKANRNFRMLQVQLEGTENRIAVERRRMNLAIREYNILIEKFPGNVVAALFDYEPRVDYFEAVPESRNAPEVDF
ncbi:LemA family protein [Puniceicoccus vermicola]|uniref:LemA family protein n=2 Tax=Puniceicoccus vermicola TaxID=388746 RepID=A0A7X1AZG8_9BACT|nr:LemA family protein [Puniceicoccus vermicola]